MTDYGKTTVTEFITEHFEDLIKKGEFLDRYVDAFGIPDEMIGVMMTEVLTPAVLKKYFSTRPQILDAILDQLFSDHEMEGVVLDMFAKAKGKKAAGPLRKTFEASIAKEVGRRLPGAVKVLVNNVLSEF